MVRAGSPGSTRNRKKFTTSMSIRLPSAPSTLKPAYRPKPRRRRRLTWPASAAAAVGSAATMLTASLPVRRGPVPPGSEERDEPGDRECDDRDAHDHRRAHRAGLAGRLAGLGGVGGAAAVTRLGR